MIRLTFMMRCAGVVADRAGYFLDLLVRSMAEAMGEPMTLLGAAASWESSADRLVATGAAIADGYNDVVTWWKGDAAEAGAAKLTQTSQPLVGRPEVYRETAVALRQGASHLVLGRYQHQRIVDGFARTVERVNAVYRSRLSEFAQYPNGVQVLTTWRQDTIEKIGQQAVNQSGLVNGEVSKGLEGLVFEQPQVFAQASGALRLAPRLLHLVQDALRALPKAAPGGKKIVPMVPDPRNFFRGTDPVPGEQPAEQCQTERRVLTDGTVEQDTPGGTQLVGSVDKFGVFVLSDTDRQPLTSNPTDASSVELTMTTRGIFATDDYGAQAGSLYSRLYTEDGDRQSLKIWGTTTSMQVLESHVDEDGEYCESYLKNEELGGVKGHFNVWADVNGYRLTKSVKTPPENRPPLSADGSGRFTPFEDRFDFNQYDSVADYSAAEARDYLRAARDTNELEVLPAGPGDRNPADPRTYNRITLHGSGKIGEQVKDALEVHTEHSDNGFGGKPDGRVTWVGVRADGEVYRKPPWWQFWKDEELIRLRVNDSADGTGIEMPPLPSS